MTTQQHLDETLKAFRRLWELNYPPKGERRRRGTQLDTAALQEAWNVYTRANVAHHGHYTATTETTFGGINDDNR
jgi:hypothetical protein